MIDYPHGPDGLPVLQAMNVTTHLSGGDVPVRASGRDELQHLQLAHREHRVARSVEGGDALEVGTRAELLERRPRRGELECRGVVIAEGTASRGDDHAGAVFAGSVSSINTRLFNSTMIYDVILVVVLGGIALSGGKGGIRNVIVGALLVGVTDTLGRILLPQLLAAAIGPAQAAGIGAALASMSIYIVMALILAFRPKGLYSAQG